MQLQEQIFRREYPTLPNEDFIIRASYKDVTFTGDVGNYIKFRHKDFNRGKWVHVGETGHDDNFMVMSEYEDIEESFVEAIEKIPETEKLGEQAMKFDCNVIALTEEAYCFMVYLGEAYELYDDYCADIDEINDRAQRIEAWNAKLMKEKPRHYAEFLKTYKPTKYKFKKKPDDNFKIAELIEEETDTYLLETEGPNALWSIQNYDHEVIELDDGIDYIFSEDKSKVRVFKNGEVQFLY